MKRKKKVLPMLIASILIILLTVSYLLAMKSVVNWVGSISGYSTTESKTQTEPKGYYTKTTGRYVQLPTSEMKRQESEGGISKIDKTIRVVCIVYILVVCFASIAPMIWFYKKIWELRNNKLMDIIDKL